MTDGGGSRHRPSKRRLYGLLTLMIFFWALNFVIGKVALREMPPLMVQSWRTTLSGLLMWPVYWMGASKRLPRERWTRADVPLLIGLGVTGVVLNQLFFVIGLSMTSVAHASVVTAMVPVTVLAMAALSGHEKLSKVKLIGMSLAIAGVASLQIGRGSVRGPSLLGDFFVFLSGLAFAAFTVFGKGISSRFGSITVNTFAYVSGAVLLIPLTLWESSSHPLGSISVGAWASVAYMAAFPAVLAYLIYSYALKHLPATRVSAFSYLQPLMATVMAALLLGELPGAGFLTGGALVLGGVFVTERG